MHIQATLTLEEAARWCWDTVVVGAGPAGTTVARLLARAGVSVLLVDRASFPRWKVCGCCLNGWALRTLQSLGLGRLTQECHAVPLSGVRLAVGRGSALLSLPEGVALSREAFDAALLREALAEGIAFLPQTRAQAFNIPSFPRNYPNYPLVPLHLRQGEREAMVTTQLLVVADGLSGGALPDEANNPSRVVPGSRIGAGCVALSAPAFFEAGTIYMACGAGGYVGLVRLEDGRLDIAAALDPVLVRAHSGLSGAVASVLGAIGWPCVPGLSTLGWRGTPALTRRRARLAGPRSFVLGDAAGYVEPFTGEGMAWALASAAVLAPIALRAIRRWEPDLARQWRVAYRHLLGPHQRLCRLIARLLRHPLLVSGLISLFSRWPALAGPIVQQLNR